MTIITGEIETDIEECQCGCGGIAWQKTTITIFRDHFDHIETISAHNREDAIEEAERKFPGIKID